MNESSLAFTDKLYQEQFSASLTLNWSSIVCLKLTIGKKVMFHAQGLLRLYLLCDNGDVRYFCHVREDMAWAIYEFYMYKNAPV